ncbi:MAG: YjgP/YjgQ family permease [Gemmatimonadetes bacterium]|nr:YjgP/YjgQ family permease [Gemmatimonadota bacterium]
MRLLTRYLIRAHLGPFFFALTTITGLLFLNAIAQRLQDLTGKGLGWVAIAEFMVLSLPHTVALTLPMATLVAVLYAFSELTTHNELTAMKAGGVNPRRLLVPLLGVGIILAEVMFIFNDQVLPEANHRLKDLLVDIGRKSPTFQLREQVVNEIRAAEGSNPVFLTATRIDQAANQMENVVIYDAEDGGAHRTTYAAHGSMAFNAARTDLFLTLLDGIVLETDQENGGEFRQVYFAKQILPLRGVGNELERRAVEGSRGEREMTVAMLQARVDDSRDELRGVIQESRMRSREALMQALGREPGPDAIQVTEVDPQTGVMGQRSAMPPPSMVGGAITDQVTEQALNNARAIAGHAQITQRAISQKQVEIQKKYSLSFACIVFVLLGAPLAMRYHGGGLGLVIAASSAIFAISWAGLIGGENLADRGVVTPVVAMWGPNTMFTVLGLWLALRMGRESGSVRGGAWDEFVFQLKSRVARLRGREESA